MRKFFRVWCMIYLCCVPYFYIKDLSLEGFEKI